MRSLARLWLILPVLALAACGGTTNIGVGGVTGSGVGIGAASGPAMDKHKREVEEWHKGRIRRLTSETGWLTLVGLFPLSEGEHTFGAADDNDLIIPGKAPAHAGIITVSGGKILLEVAPGVEMTLNGKRVTTTELATDAAGEPSEIRMGTFDFYVIDRPGSLYLRVKDAESEVRKSFTGIERYPVRKEWRVAARLEPYDPPRRLTIPNAMGFDEVVDCRGALVFEIEGKEYRLEPMSEADGEMFIVFGDATSGHETYGGGRMIYIPSPDKDGRTFIDFNRAYNPPCVFTPYATCPLPHKENVLPIRIEAGEKNWEQAAH